MNFERHQDTIYATGFFSQICGEATSFIAQWNGDSWEPASWGISDPGHSLRSIGNRLFIARYEESIDSNWVYYYEDGQLSKWGEGVFLSTASGFSELPNIYDIIEYNGTLIACGEFDRVGNQEIEGIMQWNGDHWAPMGAGLSGNILNTAPVRFPHQLFVFDNNLYVVGNFRFADGIEVNGITRWDGQSWHSMGPGFNGTVYALTVYQGDLWVGGSFTQSGNTPLNSIARWNGSGWESPGFGFTNPTVNDFTFVHTFYQNGNGDLYIAGGLKEITYSDNSTELCGGLVRYNNETLETFQGGVPNNDIEAVIQSSATLLIGGGVFNSGYVGQLDLTLSTKNTREPSPVSVFPNPFSDRLELSVEGFETFELVNVQGQCIQSGQITNTTIQVNPIPPGHYVLKLYGPNQQTTLRVQRQ